MRKDIEVVGCKMTKHSEECGQHLQAQNIVCLTALPVHAHCIHVCNSCLIDFTVYGICTARGLCVPLRKYIKHEGSTIPCTVKTMRQLSCTDRPYKANRRISLCARMSML